MWHSVSRAADWCGTEASIQQEYENTDMTASSGINYLRDSAKTNATGFDSAMIM